MAETIGFSYARIAMLDGTTEKVLLADAGLSESGIFKVDAPSSKGVISAAIAGLGPTITKIYGSNRAVGVSGQGAGNVTVTFAVNDLPTEIVNKLSGMKQDTNGAWYIDTETKPPFASLELVSEGNDQKAVHFVLYKGTFAPENRTLQTNNESVQRATDSITFTALNRDSDGRVYAEYWENDSKVKDEALEADVFPGAATTPAA